MAIAPLTSTPQQAYSEADFSPLARLGDQMRQQQQTAALADMQAKYNVGTPDPVATGAVRATGTADPAADKGVNVQSWYDFATKPADQGGLGFTHEQAAAKVANLQAESGRDIKPWGPAVDQGSQGAAQWRLDRLTNLHNFAVSKGLDPRTTAAQQAFMRHEYLGSPEQGFGGGSERNAYRMVKSARTPEQAAAAIDQYYERSSGEHRGRRVAGARYLATKLQPLKITPY